MINTKKLYERMKELGVRQSDIAELLQVARPTVSQKLRNVRPMYLDEAWKIAKKLEIAEDLFCVYFFAENVA